MLALGFRRRSGGGMDKWGNTAVHQAAGTRKGPFEVDKGAMRMLLESKADIQAQNDRRGSSLSSSAKAPHAKLRVIVRVRVGTFCGASRCQCKTAWAPALAIRLPNKTHPQ